MTDDPKTAAISDRARGTLLGLAVGDALGTTLEFSTRDSCARHTEMIGGGPFDLQPGQWTDDTSMALAESLIAHPGLDPHDLMARFVRWWRGRLQLHGRVLRHRNHHPPGARPLHLHG